MVLKHYKEWLQLGKEKEDFSVDAFEVFVLIMQQSMCVQHSNHKTSPNAASLNAVLCVLESQFFALQSSFKMVKEAKYVIKQTKLL